MPCRSPMWPRRCGPSRRRSAQINHRGVTQWRGDLIHVADGGAVLGTDEPGAGGPRRFYVVMAAGAQAPRGLLVDRLIGHQDIVVKGLDPALGRPDVVSGTTILGDGRVACILDVGPHSRGRAPCRLRGSRRTTRLLGFADAMQAARHGGGAPAPGPELHLLTFVLDREEFGIPVTQVREVIRVCEITRVPQAPPHVRGVTNLRGRILAVVETCASRLGLPPPMPPRRPASWWWRCGSGVLGLLVDRVSQVTKVPEESVAAAPGRGRLRRGRLRHRRGPPAFPAHHSPRSRQGAAADR